MAGLNAAAELHGYFLDQVEQRRRKLTDDIIGDLVAAEIDGEKLTDEAIIAFLRLLLPAGLETTYRSSGNLLYLLLTHPEQLAMVYQDRSLIPAAIEEGLRFETPLTMVMRTTTEEVEIGGKTIPADAQVDMCMGSANRDESRWTDPNTFDIRRPRQAHIAFAGGIHMCLGMHLARLETRVMLNSLFDRVKDLAFVPDDGTGEESKIVGLTFRSPNKLPVTFTPGRMRSRAAILHDVGGPVVRRGIRAGSAPRRRGPGRDGRRRVVPLRRPHPQRRHVGAQRGAAVPRAADHVPDHRRPRGFRRRARSRRRRHRFRAGRPCGDVVRRGVRPVPLVCDRHGVHLRRRGHRP